MCIGAYSECIRRDKTREAGNRVLYLESAAHLRNKALWPTLWPTFVESYR